MNQKKGCACSQTAFIVSEGVSSTVTEPSWEVVSMDQLQFKGLCQQIDKLYNALCLGLFALTGLFILCLSLMAALASRL